MTNHNVSLPGFWDITARNTKAQFFVFQMILFVFLPCFIEVPLSVAGDMQDKSVIGRLMGSKPATQYRGDAVGFVNVMQISHGVMEGRPEQQTLGVPNGGKPILFVSGLSQPVTEDRGNQYSKDCCQGKSVDKFYKLIHDAIFGLMIGFPIGYFIGII
jgi:hypothetical protein